MKKVCFISEGYLRLFWNKIPVVVQLVTTWCTYRKSKMPHLNIKVSWYCRNILDKWKLTHLIKQTLHVHFVEPINWLGLYLSYNWIMQLIYLKKLRKMLFDLFHLKTFFFFSFSGYSSFYISLIPFFSPAIAWENDRNQFLNFMTSSIG